MHPYTFASSLLLVIGLVVVVQAQTFAQQLTGTWHNPEGTVTLQLQAPTDAASPLLAIVTHTQADAYTLGDTLRLHLTQPHAAQPQRLHLQLIERDQFMVWQPYGESTTPHMAHGSQWRRTTR